MAKEYEFTEEQITIGEHWKPLVVAAGMYSSKLSPWGLYRLGGAINGDPVVKERALAQPRQRGATIEREQYLAALATFTAREKQELAERIAERYGTAPVKGAK